MMRTRLARRPLTADEMPDRDAGSAGVEAAIAVSALLLVVFFAVGAIRITGTNGDVSTAARAAARAASAERSVASVERAASSVARRILDDRGVACVGGPSVEATGAGVPGGAVTVTVSCVVDLGDVVIAGFPGTREVSASATEFVDGARGRS